MAQGTERVLEHVGSVGGAHHGDGPHVAELEIIREELRRAQDDGALGKHVADASAQIFLGAAVSDRVGGHVEEEEVSLLGAENALVDEAFAEPFADLFELVSYLHEVPSLACVCVCVYARGIFFFFVFVFVFS